MRSGGPLSEDPSTDASLRDFLVLKEKFNCIVIEQRELWCIVTRRLEARNVVTSVADHQSLPVAANKSNRETHRPGRPADKEQMTCEVPVYI